MKAGDFLLRQVLLVDMNAFFASVHQALDPTLRGKPVVVCGDPSKRHGIVLAASYEAKKYGLKTAMPVWEAKNLLPHGIFVKPNYHQYMDFSVRIINVMKDFSPLVEPFSIDEAFVDVTGCEHLFGDATQIARQIKTRIRDEIGVLCSVGIGPNKLVAKVAAEIEKPDGLTLITPKDVPLKLWPLPVKDLFGVGRRTEKKLHSLNIWTIGDLAKFPRQLLAKRFGVVGQVLHLSANGIDYSPVNPHSLDVAKSIGNQLTLNHDYLGYKEIKVAILDLAEQVGQRIRQGGYVGKTVSLTLRDSELMFYSWSISVPEYTDLTEDIYNLASRLMYTHWPASRKVRLVGVTISNLIKNQYEQIDLFGEKEKLRQLNRACDQIKERFGHDSILRAVSLTEAGIYHGQQAVGRTPNDSTGDARKNIK